MISQSCLEVVELGTRVVLRIPPGIEIVGHVVDYYEDEVPETRYYLVEDERDGDARMIVCSIDDIKIAME